MNHDDAQYIRLVLLVIGWGTVGVNVALFFWPGAAFMSLVMAWATWIYVKRRREGQ